MTWKTEPDFIGDKLEQDVRHWLLPPDPWKNHDLACESRHSGTGTWWIQGDTYAELKTSGPSSLLWVHGKRRYFLLSFPRLPEIDDSCF